MLRTRIAALTGALALAAGFGGVSAASATPTLTTSVTSVKLQAFAANVENLGETHFPGTFAGATVTSAGTVKVYATNPGDAALTSAIAKLNGGSYPVSYIAAKFSYSKLDALNSALASAQPQLQKDGVELAVSAPDAAAGTVDVTLLQPASADLARLNSSGVKSPMLGQLTTANYATAASGVISSIAGWLCRSAQLAS